MITPSIVMAFIFDSVESDTERSMENRKTVQENTYNVTTHAV